MFFLFCPILNPFTVISEKKSKYVKEKTTKNAPNVGGGNAAKAGLGIRSSVFRVKGAVSRDFLAFFYFMN